jgi:hypothetical protein
VSGGPNSTSPSNGFTVPASCRGTVVFNDDFETDQGWTVNPSGTDTATTGRWEQGHWPHRSGLEDAGDAMHWHDRLRLHEAQRHDVLTLWDPNACDRIRGE